MKLHTIYCELSKHYSKPENPTQGHMTNCHKDVSYATKTSNMPQIHQLCHKDINPRGAKIPMSQRLQHLIG